MEFKDLTWQPKTVLYRGKVFPAPVPLFVLQAYDILLELLAEREEKRNRSK